ncbi:hypothetical protein Mkiyose1088_43150 [Mycobacterium kiyosense]|nr:hypothetical protein SRL2020411_29290 [Mycobacterium kiyosense]GLD02449.1 hypothetical protein Mkiyose1088_43150 [Mycobacterium kiyosense]
MPNALPSNLKWAGSTTITRVTQPIRCSAVITASISANRLHSAVDKASRRRDRSSRPLAIRVLPTSERRTDCRFADKLSASDLQVLIRLLAARAGNPGPSARHWAGDHRIGGIGPGGRRTPG